MNGHSGWKFNREVNVAIVVQLVLLAALTVGSWVNLQRQLDSLGHNVELLLEHQRSAQQKLESLEGRSISYEYRLRAMEQAVDR